jgi:hypothetical protein
MMYITICYYCRNSGNLNNVAYLKEQTGCHGYGTIDNPTG